MNLISAMAYKYCMNEIAPKVIADLKQELNKPSSFSLSWSEYRYIKCGKVFDTDRKCLNHINKMHQNKKAKANIEVQKR